jgi:hypothetical protein
VSLPDSSSDRPQGVLVRKPQTTIYTVLLLIALVALTLGCLLMVIELMQYGFQFKPPANLRTAAAAVFLDAHVVRA